MFEVGLLSDALVAQPEKERHRFWKVRDGRALGALPHHLDFDVSLPIGILDSYVDEVTVALEAEFSGIHVHVYGHNADSNIHLCISASQINARAEHRINTIVL